MDVITTHNIADFDCLGAMVAASKFYPEAIISFPGAQEKSLRDFMEHHPNYLPKFTRAKDIKMDAITRLIIVDCQQASRIGRFAEIVERHGVEIHIYDHHPITAETIPHSGGKIGNIGSASSLLTLMLMNNTAELTAEEATLILLGIYEDTGRLLFTSTTSDDYTAAGWLLGKGANLSVVADTLNPELNKAQIELFKQLLNSIKTTSINGLLISIAYAVSEQYIADIAVLAHLMRDMENMDALFIAVAMQNHVYLIARSQNSGIDLAEIMQFFHGGGHKTAASAVIHNSSLEEVLAQLDAVLRRTLKSEATAANIMSSPVKSIPDSVSINEAREFLTRYNCNSMPVMAANRMIGVISRKTIEKAIHHELGESRVTDFMHSEFMSATPDTSVDDIQKYMLNNNRRFVPVFEKNILVGAVTRTDLMRHIYNGRSSATSPLYDLDTLKIPTRVRYVAGLLEKRLSNKTREILNSLGSVADSLELSVYAVGGFVRDLLLGVENLDIDITVEGDGIFFAERLREIYGGRVRSHKKFGTAILILPDGCKIDIASTRLEYYESPGVLPTVERASLRQDLYRRDFTINTLALCLNHNRLGQLTDYFAAQQDIQEKIVRVLHNLSFVEDPTRLFRAIRFEQRLGFHIAPHTENLMRSAVKMNLLDKLGGKRLLSELIQIMREKEPSSGIERISSFALLSFIHPSLKLTTAVKRVLADTELVMGWYRLLYLDVSCETWYVYFMALCDELKTAEFKEVCKRLELPEHLALRFCNQRHSVFVTIEKILSQLKKQSIIPNSQIYDWFNDFTIEMLLYLAAKANSEKIKRFVSIYLTKLRIMTNELNGNDLLALGVEPGPMFRSIKKKLLRAHIDGYVNNRHEEEMFIKKVLNN